MAETKSTGTLIYQWTAGDGAYRLIRVGRYNVGYKDTYLIERREFDGIGDVRWVSYARFAGDDDVMSAVLIFAGDDDAMQAGLIGVIKTLVAELQKQRIPD